jgi:hypothetical protein
MTTPTKNCGNCAHWHCPLQKHGAGIGECRRGTPIASYTWPRTRESDGCSEHKDKTFNAGAAAPSQPAAVDAGRDQGNLAGANLDPGATGRPGFARGKGAARSR